MGIFRQIYIWGKCWALRKFGIWGNDGHIGGQYHGTFLVPVPILGHFAKSFIIKKKSAQLHVPQQLCYRFVFKIQYCHPFKRSNRKILFHRKRYYEAEKEWSFRVTRPFQNDFVFEMQFKEKVSQ